MSSGVYKHKPRSEEVRKKISATHKRLGTHPPSNKGKKFSEEHRQKLSEAHKNPSQETRLKISKANKGQVAWNKGISPSKESRDKMSNAQFGKHLSLKTRRKIGEANRGRHLSEETRKKLSDRQRGEKSHMWKGGITPINRSIRNSLEYKLWRESVFARDNWTCIWCKERGGKLNADHIKPFSLYPELRFAIDNGRTLCVDCHKKTDTYLNNKMTK